MGIGVTIIAINVFVLTKSIVTGAYKKLNLIAKRKNYWKTKNVI